MLYMDNARECFASASDNFGGYNSECEFYHELARMIPDRVDVDTLILAFRLAFLDEKRRGRDHVEFIALPPQYVRQCSSSEFAHEFREKYIKVILGINVPELPDVDYGINEVKEDVIDISNKDINEVIAALYNQSTPIGMGFAQYEPFEMTKELAAYLLENIADRDEHGNIFLSYVKGRPMKLRIEGNLIYVSKYNYENEFGLAQRVIRTCPNKEVKLNYKMRDNEA